MTILMPDPQEARDAFADRPWSEYRAWWTETVLGLKVERPAPNDTGAPHV